MTLKISRLVEQRLPVLDFTESDGTDPLKINEFYKKDLQIYSKAKLSTVWVVKEDEKIIAYFTLSMNAIELDMLSKDEKVKNTTPRKYPVVLLGMMGVDKKHRSKGVGKFICRTCIGLAINTSNKIACRYVALQTTLDKTGFYEQIDFIRSKKSSKGETVWMYARLY